MSARGQVVDGASNHGLATDQPAISQIPQCDTQNPLYLYFTNTMIWHLKYLVFVLCISIQKANIVNYWKYYFWSKPSSSKYPQSNLPHTFKISCPYLLISSCPYPLKGRVQKPKSQKLSRFPQGLHHGQDFEKQTEIRFFIENSIRVTFQARKEFWDILKASF